MCVGPNPNPDPLPPSEEPELLLDANMARDHLAMLGTDITLSATIRGVPTPTVSWKKNDGDVPAHVTVAVTASGTKVFIPKCVRPDSGDYTLTVENSAGKKSVTVAVLVLRKYNLLVLSQFVRRKLLCLLHLMMSSLCSQTSRPPPGSCRCPR